MHGCCCLVTAPTGLERTQDMHTGQWPRGAAPANGSARHAARRLVLQPPSQRGRRETSARRYSQPYAHGEGAHEVTRPLSADGPPTHRTSTADSYPILRQPYSTQQRNTNKRRGCPEMPHAAHNQKPQASKRKRTRSPAARTKRLAHALSHTQAALPAVAAPATAVGVGVGLARQTGSCWFHVRGFSTLNGDLRRLFTSNRGVYHSRQGCSSLNGVAADDPMMPPDMRCVPVMSVRLVLFLLSRSRAVPPSLYDRSMRGAARRASHAVRVSFLGLD